MSDVMADETEGLVVAAAEDARTPEREAMPLPNDARTAFMGGLFLLAALAALYTASEIILPIVLALVLKLLLQPIVRMGERLHLPRFVGALIAILLLIGLVIGIGMLLTGPAATWAGKLPEAMPRIQERLGFVQAPLDMIKRALTEVQGGTDATAPVSGAQPVRLATLFDTLFSGTRALAAGFFTMLLVLFYLLVAGETFLRRGVEILPRFKDKRRAVEMSIHIERDISAYLLTVTAINAVVGLATGAVMWACGVEDPVLWGATAFGLNYVPILGPAAGVVLFALVGVVSTAPGGWAFLPAVAYLGIHIVEGEVVTPILLARRFTINPVALILALVFWYWMWGVPGAVLAVPMLAMTKIVCDDLPPLRAFGHFLEA